MHVFLKNTHPAWHDWLNEALGTMDAGYLKALEHSQDWLPGPEAVLAAFTRSPASMRYVLMGESPYPRAVSANGYAFWDAAVESLWRETGLSQKVNRATSLRNFIKMLLHARGDLTDNFSQPAIARLDNTRYHQTAEALFTGLINQGFLLLNASLVYQADKVAYHARQWAPFMHYFLEKLAFNKPKTKLVLFGRIAEKLPSRTRFSCVVAEHPYNLSFITNPDVINFFKPMDVLLHDKTG
jgi:uracil-DNA glycosylase